MARRGCIFCGSTSNKMSREHTLQRELAKWIPDATKLTRIDRIDLEGAQTRRQFDIPRGMFDQPVGGVCRNCNQGWLQDIDTAAKPTVVELALGARVRDKVKRSEIVPFANWATRSAIMRAEQNRGTKMQVASRVLRAFCDDQVPPQDAVVVEAAILNLPPAPLGGGTNGSVVFGDKSGLSSGKLNIVTIRIHRLFVRICLTDNPAMPEWHSLKRRSRLILGRDVKRIWPAPRLGVRLPDQLTLPQIAHSTNVGELFGSSPVDPRDYYGPNKGLWTERG